MGRTERAECFSTPQEALQAITSEILAIEVFGVYPLQVEIKLKHLAKWVQQIKFDNAKG
ncbi:MAG: hypothetical protein RSA63_06300 [Eubacterium sp.]